MAPTEENTFPPDRADRPTLLSTTAPEARRRYWALSEHIAYFDIRNIVADYINATIPDPAATQGRRWTAAALQPSDDANQRRLLTLTCGSLETLIVTEYTNDEDDSIELEMTVNTAIPDGWSEAQLEISNDVVTAARGTYPSRDVWTWRIDIGALLTDDVEVDFGIEDDLFDDLAYALNISLMSETTPETEDYSDDLAGDLVAEAYRQIVDAEGAPRM